MAAESTLLLGETAREEATISASLKQLLEGQEAPRAHAEDATEQPTGIGCTT